MTFLGAEIENQMNLEPSCMPLRRDYSDVWATADRWDQGREEELETSDHLQDQTEAVLRQTREALTDSPRLIRQVLWLVEATRCLQCKRTQERLKFPVFSAHVRIVKADKGFFQ
jgi:hypothetical protein